jgi:hypothetical protein
MGELHFQVKPATQNDLIAIVSRSYLDHIAILSRSHPAPDPIDPPRELGFPPRRGRFLLALLPKLIGASKGERMLGLL